MIARIIAWSIHRRYGVLAISLAILVWGGISLYRSPLDAIPDLSDTQVIVKAPFLGQPPSVVENQVTYPLTTAFLTIPGVRHVRGYSDFGNSLIYILFKEGTDPYWARSRVLEYLNQVEGRLPAGVVATLGPDATGLGWIYEYALVDKTHRYDLSRLRALQDWFLKFELQSVHGVAQVASVGGMVKEFQVEADPRKLLAYHIPLSRVEAAIRDANGDVGGSVVDMGEAQYMVRTRGYIRSLSDIRKIPLKMGAGGIPVRISDVASVHLGPELRQGIAELDGKGEVAGGIVIAREGTNSLKIIEAVRKKLKELAPMLPPGVEVVTTYDRSGLILKSIRTLLEKLLEESVAVSLVCLLFLSRIRSSLVAILSLPVGIFAAFVLMAWQGLTANIMSLGGIAVSVGVMVDAAIVMIENMHKHRERSDEAETSWETALRAAQEVGPSLFFSLLVITVSFLPIFALQEQEGRLFKPLAFTKTYSIAISAGLSITLVPVLMGFLIRGKMKPEEDNVINRMLVFLYRPVIGWVLRHKKMTIAFAVACLATAAIPMTHLGTEFMPPLYEGDLLYMPTLTPGVSVGESSHLLQITDRLIKTVPEVAQVFGQSGRAETATDSAHLTMFDTVVTLKPRSQWPPGTTLSQVRKRLNRVATLPGVSNIWTMPIINRVNMLTTGIKSPLGLKITAPSLDAINRIDREIQTVLKKLPDTSSVYADRLTGGRYIVVDINRSRAARYGINVGDVNRLVLTAIGGERLTTVIQGRERFPVNLRYPRDDRGSMEAIGASLVSAPDGSQVPLSRLASLTIEDGPTMIKTENARLTGWIYIEPKGGDLGGYVDQARKAIARSITLPPGTTLSWSGQYASIERARKRLALVLPLAIGIIVALLFVHFRSAAKTGMVLLSLPFAVLGSLWFLYGLHYRLSVAVVTGMIALAGVAAEFGIVMILYLDRSVERRMSEGRLSTAEDLDGAIVEGTLYRLRPIAMTGTVILAGLLPIMWSHKTGSDVMKRIAAPMVGGMVTAMILSLLVIPVLFRLWKEADLRRRTLNGDSGPFPPQPKETSPSATFQHK
ncbi:MAG: Heavy metal efflux pump, CzcA family [Leptospirillum sp. Group II 'C75']|uniref:Heavy metal efflux pump, CzcA family n=1 Tax=Leptospirillum sp. Group II '5-way CG' TaxID=419541 RepID=B6ARY9_9BACT|nr:CusA/CzcA family heavy metal efflux RND transporter [Leptospirillum sp. Group II 'CF-1']AKS23148.1 cation transporter [Leptospirillum sp. Group II 'CF-1']EAY57038.1 MAG: Heavy metal efflux pump, CzcA family [Leptospirillum rubarum]EDZ38235.1 MAG: Heavy metal efflux pump, CzcA family [Leptospirillum sp. Group II '5-way CG']EIJ75227.1 MAG: Heavy metal efflux pump, CzcA family [Leptospirillum sp. Group II 'C75']